jgi:hypothetical protein
MTPTKNLQCTSCLHISKINSLVFDARRKSGLEYPCRNEACDADLCSTGTAPKRGKTDSQKRSKKQEKRAAKRVGGYTTSGSGSGREKGDVRAAWDTRIECKETTAKSYSLKLADLEKLEREAAAGEDPVFEIEFQGVFPHKRYAVIPGWLFDQYRETNRAKSNTDD